MISPLTGIFPTLGLTVGLAKNDFWLQAYAYNLQIDILIFSKFFKDKNSMAFFLPRKEVKLV